MEIRNAFEPNVIVLNGRSKCSLLSGRHDRGPVIKNVRFKWKELKWNIQVILPGKHLMGYEGMKHKSVSCWCRNQIHGTDLA